MNPAPPVMSTDFGNKRASGSSEVSYLGRGLTLRIDALSHTCRINWYLGEHRDLSPSAAGACGSGLVGLARLKEGGLEVVLFQQARARHSLPCR